MYPCALSDITHYGIGKLRIKIILMTEQQQNKIAIYLQYNNGNSISTPGPLM